MKPHARLVMTARRSNLCGRTTCSQSDKIRCEPPQDNATETTGRRSSEWWSIVSNDADRSRRNSTARFPESSARRMSPMTFKRAVSVEWWAWYADCRCGSRLLSVKYLTSCRATSCSSAFETTDRLVIDWYDLTSAASRLAFFNSGIM